MNLPSASKSDVNTLIDQTLVDFFESSIAHARTIDVHYETLWKNLYALHSSGGKRIRPKIVMLAYSAFGGIDIDAVVPIACAHELLHFSMLIHDDIIDRDTIRYGVDNISGRYENIYGPFVSSDVDRTHYANSAAIMAGDLMITSAYNLIATSSVPNDQKILAQHIMYQSIFDVVGGELLDTESAFRPIGSIDSLKVAHFKTASYSFVGPFITGASLAHATKAELDILKKLAVNLGIAYQLTDDLLGVFGDEEKTGKSNTGDIREGKRTYLVESTVKQLTPEQLPVFLAHFGKHDATEDQVDSVRELMTATGARHDTEQQIEHHTLAARTALRSLSLPKTFNEQFERLIDQSTKREF
jgi:geranylgeranyl pyrophosphate synthase